MLLGETRSVSASVYGNAVDGHKISKPLHLAVDLLRQLPSGSHHDAIDRILRHRLIHKAVDDRQQIGGCLSRSGLRHRYKVATVKNHRYRLLLDRSAFIKIHRVERVKYIVAKIQLVKSHNYIVSS